MYVTTPDAYLSKDGLNVVISVNQKEIFRIPVHNIEQIVTFGYVGASPGLMKLCADSGVALTFLSPQGRFISRSQGPTKGNVLLRKAQYQRSDNPDYALHLCRLFIGAKIQNYRNILRRFVRDNGSDTDVERAADELSRCRRKVINADSVERVRGIEGDAATSYFSVFPHLILNQKESFVFSGQIYTSVTFQLICYTTKVQNMVILFAFENKKFPFFFIWSPIPQISLWT